MGFLLGAGTRVHLSVAEKLRFGWYDGCQAAVWALGMMLVESRSPCLLSSIRRPHTVFSKPEKAFKRRSRIPEHLTPGNVINNLFNFIYQKQGLKPVISAMSSQTLPSFKSNFSPKIKIFVIQGHQGVAVWIFICHPPV